MPVGPVLAIAIYIIWWWMALFIVLPIGVKNLAEAGVNEPAHEQGAPEKPMLKQKMLWATGLAAIFWAMTMGFIAWDPMDIR